MTDRIVCLILIFLLITPFATAVVNAKYNLSPVIDYEGYDIGDVADAAGGFAVGADPDNPLNKVAMTSLRNIDVHYPVINFGSAKGEIMIEYKLRFETRKNISWYNLTTNPAALAVRVEGSNNQVMYSIGASTENSAAKGKFDENSWYGIKIALRTDDAVYDLYVYDLAKNVCIVSIQNIQCMNSNIMSGLNGVDFRYRSSNADADNPPKFYVDNFKIAKREDIDFAEDAVERAELSNAQTDVDAARQLVNALPDGAEKDSLIDRLDTLQSHMDNPVAVDDSSGFYGINESRAYEFDLMDGNVIIESAVKFKGRSYEALTGGYISFASGERVSLWRLQPYHNLPGLYLADEQILGQNAINNDVWYKVRVALNLNENPLVYDVYLIDVTHSRVVGCSKGHVIEGNKSDISGYEVINSGIAAVDCDTEVKDIKAYGADNIDEVRLNIELCGLLKEQGLIDETEDMIDAMPYSAIKGKLQNELDVVKLEKAINAAEASLSAEDTAAAKQFMNSLSVEVERLSFQARLDDIENQIKANEVYSNPNNYVAIPPSERPEQKAAFDSRHSDKSINELGEEFFKLIDLTKPGLEYAKRMVIEGDYKEALRAFKVYLLNKLRNYSDDDVNLLINYGGNPPGTTDLAATTAAELMNGIIQNSGLKKAKFTTPGTMDWAYDPPVLDPTGMYARVNQHMWGMGKFIPLAEKYAELGNQKYLDKWNDILADWSMHQDGFKGLLPAYISDGFQSGIGGTMVRFMIVLKKLADRLPDDGEGLDDFTLANVLKTAYLFFPPIQLSYMRSNPQNWTDASIPFTLGFAVLYDDFIESDEYAKEAVRLLDSLLYGHKLPDGTSPEQDPTYNRNFLDYATKIETLRILKKFRPDLLTQFREREIKDMQLASANFFIRLLYMNDKYPPGFRIDYRTQADGIKRSIEKAVPEALYDLDNSKIMSAVKQQDFSQAPSFNSEFYPYGGYYIMREGWGLNSQIGTLFSSPQSGVCGESSTFGCNSISLAAFNEDMLLRGEIGHYGNMVSAITVDGHAQNGVFGLYRWGHRNVMAPVWDNPADVRWHTSDKFDVSEGVFDNKFGTVLYANNVQDAVGGKLPSYYKIIDGVAHQRLFSFLRDAGVWILTDRMLCQDSHNYSQALILPVNTAKPHEYKTFDANLIQLDNACKTVKTQNADRSNLSVYQFSTAPINITSAITEVGSGNAYKVSDFYQINTTFSGEGDQMLITLLYPRETKDVELASVTPITGDGVAGFSAVVNEGKTVSYLAANGKDGLLSIGNIAMQGESLAIVENGGEVTGYAMGCNSFSIDGIAQTVLSADFEFSIISNALHIESKIYKPLKEVTILPEADVFTDNADATLLHEEDVDIYYTLDGSEPTLFSPKYAGPINLTDTTMVKAKAYRKDLAAEPQKMNGTLTSAVRTAVYTKRPPNPSIYANATENGLSYKYYEDYWQKMFTKTGIDDMIPVKTGTVVKLLDISPRGNAQQFGFRYSGYINVDEDGIYTFYKPKELYAPYIITSYELNLYIDGERWRPAERKQGYGTWSIPLKKGLHAFEVDYVDARGDAPEKLNASLYFTQQLVWGGTAPIIEISGPNLAKQPIPDNMLFVSSSDTDEINAEASFYFDGKNGEPPVDITKIGITSGEIITKYSIENNSSKTLEGRLITALYKVENGSINLVECKTSEDVLSLESGESGSIEQSVFVPSDGKHYEIHIMLWDSLYTIKNIANKAVLN
ncbi:MAG: chitobiase/beta-hexosaminidase C-terminal domain-containing protein [Firmicutes bacterium]|nr:chitobiase/beta-hexosaminidase C-terminal domain-containing protein [Bacillota bacterium]